jgi:hypothetical protein
MSCPPRSNHFGTSVDTGNRPDDPTSDTALICAYTSCPGPKPSTRCARRVMRARIGLTFPLPLLGGADEVIE